MHLLWPSHATQQAAVPEAAQEHLCGGRLLQELRNVARNVGRAGLHLTYHKFWCQNGIKKARFDAPAMGQLSILGNL